MKWSMVIAICIALSGCVEPSGNYLFAEKSASVPQDQSWRPGACRQIATDIETQRKQNSTVSNPAGGQIEDSITGLQQHSATLHCAAIASATPYTLTTSRRITGLTECIADCYERTGRQHALCENSCIQ